MSNIFRDFFVKENQSSLESLEVLVVLVLVLLLLVKLLLVMVQSQQLVDQEHSHKVDIKFTITTQQHQDHKVLLM